MNDLLGTAAVVALLLYAGGPILFELPMRWTVVWWGWPWVVVAVLKALP